MGFAILMTLYATSVVQRWEACGASQVCSLEETSKNLFIILLDALSRKLLELLTVSDEANPNSARVCISFIVKLFVGWIVQIHCVEASTRGYH